MAYQQAGWYSDPAGDTSKLRYWDGSQWTDQYTDATAPPPSEVPPVAASTVVMSVEDNGERQTSYVSQAAPVNQSNGLATGSLVCGIIGLCFGIVSIVAIILAVQARKRPGGQGLATAGLVLGIIGVVGWAIGMILYGGLLAAYLAN